MTLLQLVLLLGAVVCISLLCSVLEVWGEGLLREDDQLERDKYWQQRPPTQ